MSQDPVTKVEITAHNSIIDSLLEELQELSIIQIDPHRIKEWESEKSLIAQTGENISELKRELLDVERALSFLEKHEEKVSLLQKLSMQPDRVSKDELKAVSQNKNAVTLKEQALDVEQQLTDTESSVKDLRQKIYELEPLRNFDVQMDLLYRNGGKTEVIVSKLENEAYEKLSMVASDLLHIERISGGMSNRGSVVQGKAEMAQSLYLGANSPGAHSPGGDDTYFFILYHTDAEEHVQQIEKDFRFEPLVLEYVDKKPSELVDEYVEEIRNLELRKEKLLSKASDIAGNIKDLRYYCDYLQTELEKEITKEKFFYTEKVFVIHGWTKKRDIPELKKVIGRRGEAYIGEVEKDGDEVPPVAYKNNPMVSPFEIIVNLYSPPNHKEIDPTPVLMPFYAVFFGICLTDAGYGLIIALVSLIGMSLIKKKNGFKKFLKLFFILGIFTFVIGALIGTVFGINFDLLPESLSWLREARYKIMIFDSGKDVLTFFALALTLGVIHLITGYIVKIYMLLKSGDWVEAVCDHLPWIFLLLAPAPKVLMRFIPQYGQLLDSLFYVLIALWAGIIVLFSERNSLNPIKRIGKGLFTLYGVSGVLGDILSYSRLLALGLATGVIAGVMNTLAGMVKQIPIVGIVGFVLVLIVGHLFNLFISGLSAFVHSIRLQFMEFFTKFYTGEGELLEVFSEKRKYTYSKPRN